MSGYSEVKRSYLLQLTTKLVKFVSIITGQSVMLFAIPDNLIGQDVAGNHCVPLQRQLASQLFYKSSRQLQCGSLLDLPETVSRRGSVEHSTRQTSGRPLSNKALQHLWLIIILRLTYRPFAGRRSGLTCKLTALLVCEEFELPNLHWWLTMTVPQRI